MDFSLESFSKLPTKTKVLIGVGAAGIVLFIWQPWNKSSGSAASTGIEAGSNPSGVSSDELTAQIGQMSDALNASIVSSQGDTMTQVQQLLSQQQAGDKSQFDAINQAIVQLTSQHNSSPAAPAPATGKPTTVTKSDGVYGTNNSVIGSGVVTASALNVRSGPGTNYSKLKSISKGGTYQVYQTATSGGQTWYNLGRNQWVSGQYFKLK